MPIHVDLTKLHKLKLTTEPSRGILMIKRAITVFAVVAPFTNVPQLVKIYSERSADLSLLSWSLYIVFTIPFIIYGIVDRDRLVLINSCMNLVMLITIVTGILLYA